MELKNRGFLHLCPPVLKGNKEACFGFKGSKLVGGRDVARAGRVLLPPRAAESKGGKVDT